METLRYESWSFLRNTLPCINFAYQSWKLRSASFSPSIVDLLFVVLSHINNDHAAWGCSVWIKSRWAAGLLIKNNSERLTAAWSNASETHLKLSLLARTAPEDISVKRQWNSPANMPTAVLSLLLYSQGWILQSVAVPASSLLQRAALWSELGLHSKLTALPPVYIYIYLIYPF